MTPPGYNRAEIERLVESASVERIEAAIEKATEMQRELGITVHAIEVKGEMVYTVEAVYFKASRAAFIATCKGYTAELKRNSSLRLSLVLAVVFGACGWGALAVNMVCR